MNASVRPNYSPFNLHWPSCLQRFVHRVEDYWKIIGMNQFLEGALCSSKPTWRQTIHCLQFRRPDVHARLHIPFEGANASNLLRQSQPFLAGTQRLLCITQFSNVGASSKPTSNSSIRISDRHDAG